MGLKWPNFPGDVQDGDEPSFSPTKTQNSLLGAERGTQFTRRLEVDNAHNLYVNIGANSSLSLNVVNAIAGNGITSIPANTLSTIVTYTAATAKRVSKISVSGTEYAKFQLFKNSSLIETRRSGPERSIDFLFPIPFNVASGDIIDVKVTHFAVSVLADFESTVYGV